VNCFHEHTPTFSVPCALLEQGILAQLSPGALRLYLSLLLVSQVRGAPVIDLKPELVALVGLDNQQITLSAIELRRAELSIGPFPDGSFHLMANGRCLPALKGRTVRGQSTKPPRPAPGALITDQKIAGEGATS
jgi:hypothetical protein